MNIRFRVCQNISYQFPRFLIVSKTLVGPPPESAAVSGPHDISCIVVISGLPFDTTDSVLKRECIETVGRPKFIYMHVSDHLTGMFSGTAVIEFSNKSNAESACNSGIMGASVRIVNPVEFAALTSSEWPMLEYGPPQGVFAAHMAQSKTSNTGLTQPAPQWAQPNRPPPSNPWQR
jgi:hypothetical protein